MQPATKRAVSALTSALILALVVCGALASSSFGDASGSAAGLAFLRVTASSDSVWVAAANGAGQRRLGPGDSALLSPNGEMVATSPYLTKGRQLIVYRSGGGVITSLPLLAKQSVRPLAWSPDSIYLAVMLGNTGTGNGVGNGRLDVIDVSTGQITATVPGIISGASFAPSGTDELVYSLAHSQLFTAATNLYTLAADGSTPAVQLTHDGHSLAPVWGATGIVFDRERLRGESEAPAYHLELLNGTTVTSIASPSPGPLVDGLVPMALSADGQHLLAEYEGQDTSEAYAVDLTSNRFHPLAVGDTETLGWGISQDGTRVLISYGGFETSPQHSTIATIPFTGGSTSKLVKGGDEPSWNQ